MEETYALQTISCFIDFPYCWHLGLSMRMTSALYAVSA